MKASAPAVVHRNPGGPRCRGILGSGAADAADSAILNSGWNVGAAIKKREHCMRRKMKRERRPGRR